METQAGTAKGDALPAGLIAGVLRHLPVASWAMYDFANSIFALNVLGLYFALWVTVDHGAPDLFYSMVLSGSMLLVAVTSPVLGAISDRYGRRMPFLVFFTLLCIGFTAGIGSFGGLLGGLLMFAVANYGYQAGLVYYDALLTSVSEGENRGWVSGLGVGLGYAGAILGIVVVGKFVDVGGREAAFLPTAGLFLLFALPCFLLVKEKSERTRWRWEYAKAGYRQLLDTLRALTHYRSTLRFIGARFLYVDAINTVTTFMTVYLVKVVGFDAKDLVPYFVVTTSFAVLGAFAYGKVVDRLGPKRTLVIVLAQWAGVLLAVSLTFAPQAFWVIGAVAGMSLGATWTTDRVFLTRLSPPERLGEFFGVYELAGRFSAVIGPQVWGWTTLLLQGTGEAQYRVGILALLLVLLAGFAVLLGVREGEGPASSGVAP